MAKTKKPQSLTIPTRWDLSENIPTVYSNQMLITHAGNEFFIIFGEMIPPMILERTNLKEIPKVVNIKPVVKIAVTFENMLKFKKAIDKNVDKFIEKNPKVDKDNAK